MRQTRQHVAAEMVVPRGWFPLPSGSSTAERSCRSGSTPPSGPSNTKLATASTMAPPTQRPGRTTPRARMQIAKQRREA